MAAGATVLTLAAVLTATALAATASPEIASKSAQATVGIREFAFHPGQLPVDRGTKVVFANREKSIRHTATKHGSFNTGPIRPGHSVSVRFGRSGTYAYHCMIHPEMRAKIVVR